METATVKRGRPHIIVNPAYISLSLPTETRDALAKWCTENQRSMAQGVRMAIEKMLKEQ